MLVIEDDVAIAAILDEVLTMEGHEVSMEFDGLAGLNRLKTLPPPDVILLDLALPGLRGRCLVERFLEDPRLKPVPVVLMTAAVQPNLFPRPGTYRALLRKPFEVDEILNALSAIVGSDEA